MLTRRQRILKARAAIRKGEHPGRIQISVPAKVFHERDVGASLARRLAKELNVPLDTIEYMCVPVSNFQKFVCHAEMKPTREQMWTYSYKK